MLACWCLIPCAAGAKVMSNAQATLLPNIKERDAGAEVFAIMSRTLNDDKPAFEMLCPGQVNMPGA
jgi:hypothetical protein